MSQRPFLLLFALTTLCAACLAAEAPGTLVGVKLDGGLEYIGAVKSDNAETLTLITLFGEKTFRRSAIAEIRRQLSDDERARIMRALVEAKSAGALVAQDGVERPQAARPTQLRDAEPGPERGFNVARARHLGPYERMERQLERKITVEFIDTPLEDTLAFLNQVTGLNIIMNPKLKDTKPVVTLRVQEMDCATVIRWLTRLTETYADLKDQAIWITDKPSKEAEDEERQDIQNLAAQLRAEVELPPEGTPLSEADRVKIALQLWEKEQARITDFPGPEISVGAAEQTMQNPFAVAPGR